MIALFEPVNYQYDHFYSSGSSRSSRVRSTARKIKDKVKSKARNVVTKVKDKIRGRKTNKNTNGYGQGGIGGGGFAQPPKIKKESRRKKILKKVGKYAVIGLAGECPAKPRVCPLSRFGLTFMHNFN